MSDARPATTTRDHTAEAVRIIEAFLEASMRPDPEAAAAFMASDVRITFTGGRVFAHPREATAFNSVGVAHIRLGHFDDSVAAFREAIRLDPKFTPAYGNLAAALLAVNRYDEARGVLAEAPRAQAQRWPLLAAGEADFVGRDRARCHGAMVRPATAHRVTQVNGALSSGTTQDAAARPP